MQVLEFFTSLVLLSLVDCNSGTFKHSHNTTQMHQIPARLAAKGVFLEISSMAEISMQFILLLFQATRFSTDV